MILIKQAEPDKHCGQYCIAMITGQDPDFVLEFEPKERTDTADLKDALSYLGFGTDKRLQPFKNFPAKSKNITAILKVKFDSGNSHWVVFDKFAVLDPIGIVASLEEYQWLIKGKITSYLTVWKKS